MGRAPVTNDCEYLQTVVRDGALARAAATLAVAQYEEFCFDADLVAWVVGAGAFVSSSGLAADEVGVVRMLLLSHGFDPRPRPSPPWHESVLDVAKDWSWMGRFTIAIRFPRRFAREVARESAALLRQVHAVSYSAR